MVPWKLLKYAALAVGAFVLVSAAVSIVGTVVGIAASILVAIVAMLAVAGLTYALVKGLLWWRGTSSESSRSTVTGSDDADRVDRLTEQYVDGQLSESQLEQRLESELDGSGSDDVERELERLRS
ncbi:hypothetical protein OB920_15985 [Halobacteria archaeon HArc-gm2]|nr:hypothetical protein [Halobacteria archaeon HArc-gm2]